MRYTKLNKFLPLIFQSMGRLSSQALGFLMGVVIVRSSGIEILGLYAEYNALINLTFGVLASGLYTNYLRSNKIELLGQTIIGISWIFLISLIIIIPVISQIFEKNFFNIILVIISAYFIQLSEVYILTTRFLGIDKYSILPRSIPYVIIIILCLIFEPKNISTFLLLICIGWFSITYFIIKIRDKIKWNKIKLKTLMSSSIILSFTTLATQVFANFDQVMIGRLLDSNILGSYRIGISFSVLAMPIIGVFSFMYISDLKKFIEMDNINALKIKFYDQLKINFIVSFTLFIFCFLFLKKIILFVYGIEDTNAGNIGIVLSLSVVFNVLSMVFSYSLLSINKDKLILIALSCGVGLNIILNYIFIIEYGAIGAAFTSVLTQLFLLLVLSYFFYIKVNFFKYIKTNIISSN